MYVVPLVPDPGGKMYLSAKTAYKYVCILILKNHHEQVQTSTHLYLSANNGPAWTSLGYDR